MRQAETDENEKDADDGADLKEGGTKEGLFLHGEGWNRGG